MGVDENVIHYNHMMSLKQQQEDGNHNNIRDNENTDITKLYMKNEKTYEETIHDLLR